MHSIDQLGRIGTVLDRCKGNSGGFRWRRAAQGSLSEIGQEQALNRSAQPRPWGDCKRIYHLSLNYLPAPVMLKPSLRRIINTLSGETASVNGVAVDAISTTQEATE